MLSRERSALTLISAVTLEGGAARSSAFEALGAVVRLAIGVGSLPPAIGQLAQLTVTVDALAFVVAAARTHHRLGGALRELTGAVATVVFFEVSVVARFTHVENAVSAVGTVAAAAIVARSFTCLSIVQNAISASRQGAVVAASIGVVTVVVVTLLVVLRLVDAIATVGAVASTTVLTRWVACLGRLDNAVAAVLRVTVLAAAVTALRHAHFFQEAVLGRSAIYRPDINRIECEAVGSRR